MLQSGVYAHKVSGDIAILYITKFNRREYYFWQYDERKMMGDYDPTRVPCQNFEWIGEL